MARTSRKHLQLGQNTPVKRIFKTGIYVRLSVKEEGGKTDTIENQEALIRSFLQGKPEFHVVKVYVDHGKTGVNFKREGYQQLENDLKNKVIDCVAVKDFSRFARNYLGAGEFLETIFTQNNQIRFISVNDNFDSFSATGIDQQIMHLTNLSHQLYAQDLSSKIAPVLEKLQNEGKFIGAWAAYGYQKDPNDRYKIIVDEETKDNVILIFDLKLQGMGTTQIVRYLNHRNIPSPSCYRYGKGWVKDEKWKNKIWNGSSVKTILTNEVYLGHMVQGRKQESLAKGKTQKYLPKDQWKIVYNTHEPIISEEVFQAVQKIISDKTAEYHKTLGKYNDISDSENIIKAMLTCGCCGANLFRYKKVRTNKKGGTKVYYSYICPTHTKDQSSCAFVSIQEEKVKDILLKILQHHSQIAKDYQKIFAHKRFQEESNLKKQEHFSKLRTLNHEKNRIVTLKLGLHDSYLSEEITSEDFSQFSKNYTEKLAEVEKEIEIEEENHQYYLANTPLENDWLNQALLFTENVDLTNEMLKTFFSKIVVTLEKNLEITLNYSDEYERLSQLAKGEGE